MRQIPEPRHICLEEGALSEWLYEELDALEALKAIFKGAATTVIGRAVWRKREVYDPKRLEGAARSD